MLELIEDLGMMYPTEKSKRKYRFGLYKCFCGNKFKVQIAMVKNKNTNSCGCLQKQRIKESNTTHGQVSHRLYYVWYEMIQRCNNLKHKDYVNYGARGIKVCNRWLNVANFIEDMYPSYQEGQSIDRKENDKGYSPDNCRWVYRDIQNRNKRKIQSNNKSGYKGVSWHKASNKWSSQITVKGKKIYLGVFNEINKAIKAYDDYITNNNLEYIKNFN